MISHESVFYSLFTLQLAVAKIMEQGPVLIMTFVAQQTMVVKDTRGNIIEGKEVGFCKLNLPAERQITLRTVVNKSISQSISQSINQSINQYINQSINQSIKLLGLQPAEALLQS